MCLESSSFDSENKNRNVREREREREREHFVAALIMASIGTISMHTGMSI